MTIMPKDLTRLARAYHFAASQHINQRRKGLAAEPYVNHLTEVAELVADACGGEDPSLIMAAVLHDTVEDTETTGGIGGPVRDGCRRPCRRAYR